MIYKNKNPHKIYESQEKINLIYPDINCPTYIYAYIYIRVLFSYHFTISYFIPLFIYSYFAETYNISEIELGTRNELINEAKIFLLDLYSIEENQ